MITNAYDTANIVLNDALATKEQCLEAWVNLANALHYADFKADKSDLITLINICKDLKEEIFSAGWDAMIVAFNEAVVVNTNENALQASNDAAHTTLLNAYNALVKNENVSKDFLSDLVDQFTDIDASIYCNNAAWVAFVQTLDNAKAVLADDSATASQISEAILALTSAYEDIRLLPDEAILGQLKGFLDMLENVNMNAYCAENISHFLSVAGKACMMVNDPNTYDPAILDEIAEINNIIENEQIVTPEDPTPEVKDPEAFAGDVTLKEPNEQKGVATAGDATNTTALLGLALASGAGLYAANKKTQRKEIINIVIYMAVAN